MKRIYYLSTCDTCKKILQSIDTQGFELLDIKQNPLREKQLDELYAMTGSYEKLFSKRARLYKSLGLKDKNLSESDFKKYLLQDYTFLQRPVLVDGDYISVGSSPKTKKELQEKYPI
ncbi:arsenate reductase [Ornithobacterium rhinotracheale]|uniref:Arsenate reductase n=1 Tax=Ornithobacterium rhinotracheale TaxID=28251 RepID=A0A3R5UWM4_ORNRH|nr:ArsC/Spx/MgsR family protein [Ornithobacterium rhinotracheale]QAR30315.1 arsenate reductase [Ornithobacterium rhinotracheale]